MAEKERSLRQLIQDISRGESADQSADVGSAKLSAEPESADQSADVGSAKLSVELDLSFLPELTICSINYIWV